MSNFFRHKAKKTDTAPEALESTAAPPQVQVEAAPEEAVSTPEPMAAAVPDTIFWSGASVDGELIRVEEKWQDDVLVVRAELPGVDPDRDVRLTVRNRHLVIEAERRQQDTINRDGYVVEEQSCALFTQAIPLRDGVDASMITGTYRDGVLEVRIPMPGRASTEPAVMIPITT